MVGADCHDGAIDLGENLSIRRMCRNLTFGKMNQYKDNNITGDYNKAFDCLPESIKFISSRNPNQQFGSAPGKCITSVKSIRLPDYVPSLKLYPYSKKFPLYYVQREFRLIPH